MAGAADFQEAARSPGGDGSGAARIFYGLALATLIAVIAYFGRGVFIPLVVAGFLSFLMHTLKETIRRGPLIGRFMPDWLCYLLAFALIVSIFVLLIEIIRNNVDALIAAAPLYEERLRSITESGVAQLRDAGVIPDNFVGGVEQLRAQGLSLFRPVLSHIGDGARSLTGNSVTIFLYTVFMLLERGRIFRKIDMLNPDAGRRAAVNETIAEIGSLIRQYVTVKTIANLITAIVSYAILSIIGVDFAGFWAMLIFVLNFIPIVGAVGAIALPALLALVQPEGGGMQTAMLALVLLVAAEQTMSSAIEPRIIGKSLNLSPLVILLSLAVWGTIWGFAGLLLAVPFTVTIMIILTQFRSTRPIAILLSENGAIAPIRHAPIEPSSAQPA